MSNRQPARPAALHPHGFPTFHAYQLARTRELTAARIRNMRATNRHLSLKQIAYHTGVSTAYVQEVLAHDPIGPP